MVGGRSLNGVDSVGTDETAITVSPPQEIVMQEAGPIRAWWDGLSPSTKTIFKAAALGAAIFVGKKIFDVAKKKFAASAVKEMAAVDEEDDDEPSGTVDHLHEDYEDDDLPFEDDSALDDEPAN
jgi:hypothetical protein